LPLFARSTRIDPAASSAALEQGLIYNQAGEYVRAVEALTEVSTAYPQSPEAPEALLRAAATERDNGDLARALALYDQLGAKYPDSDQARIGLFEAGMRARTQDPVRAAEFFARVGSAQGFVWQGKLLEQAGSPDLAQQAWEQASSVSGTFFAMRACELQNGLEPFAPSATLQLEPITDSDRLAAEQWVAQTFNIPRVSADLSPELAAHPMLQRGVELWAVGMWAEARAEFDALHKLKRDDPVALLQLAFYYQSIPVFRSSLFAATRLVFASEVPFSRIPRAVLQLAYPLYYLDLFVGAAQEYAWDPLLVAALARQESSFDATNVSAADARGLMQLLPATAQEVATQLGSQDYTVNDLYRPVVNIPFGVHYLNSMRAFQDGSVAGALLSYNAGPGATASWMSEAGNDLELLYQSIPYEETKQYLDFIYQGRCYRHLYGDGVPLCMFEGILSAEETPAN
jgi:soluble lytic murein transglycosylase